MPETALYQDDLAMPGKHDVRSAWQVFSVQPEPEAKAVQDRAHSEFWLRVFATYAAHQRRPFSLCNRVHKSI